MSYYAVGRGTLVLRSDEQSVNGLKAGMRTYYDAQCQSEQGYAVSDSLKESIFQRYETKKRMLDQSDLRKWLLQELHAVGFSDFDFDEDPTQQHLYVYVSFDGKYYEQRIMPLLELLSPYTIEGSLAFQGEDDALWRLLFSEAVWTEQSGEIVYNDPRQTDATCIAIHLDWDALGRRLESLVQQRLNLPCKISLKRVDYYFWEMSLDTLPDVDEKQSAEICKCLELLGVEPDHFMDGDSVDNNQLLPLLACLTHYEVASSHADDYGVWIICKDFQTHSTNHVETDSGTPASGTTPLPSPEMIQRGKQCLIDSGIAPDAAETALQALGHILFNPDTALSDKQVRDGVNCSPTMPES